MNNRQQYNLIHEAQTNLRLMIETQRQALQLLQREQNNIDITRMLIVIETIVYGIIELQTQTHLYLTGLLIK